MGDITVIPSEIDFEAFKDLTDDQQHALLVDGGYQFFTSGELVEAEFVPGVIGAELSSSEIYGEPFIPLPGTENTYLYKGLVRIESEYKG